MTRAGGPWLTTTTPTVSVDLPFVPLETDWRDQAACREADPRLFDYDPETDPEDAAEPARRICASCRVRAACLSYALSQPAEDDSVGIYGGLTPAERSGRRVRGTRSHYPACDPEFAVSSFELAGTLGAIRTAKQLNVSTRLLYRAWDRQALGWPPKPEGWTKQLMADRELVEQAFELAREHSILAAASAFQVNVPTLRRAFAHHGLGHPHAGFDRAELQRRWSTGAKDAPDHHHREQRRRYRARLSDMRRAR
jgi:WhiB family redox-sensing transcriptional regulator